MGICFPKPTAAERKIYSGADAKPASATPVHSHAKSIKNPNPRAAATNIVQHRASPPNGGGNGRGVRASGHLITQHRASPLNGGGNGSGVRASGHIITPNLKMFTLEELEGCTRNFRADSLLGEGGFGRVFKGWIDEKTYSPSKFGVGMPVAVKKSNPNSDQGLKEWQAEVNFLGKFCHPNLVKLLGYCWEDRQFLLVYEYMEKGSLESHLFRKDVAETIPWDTRIKIAIGAAKGLAFLHTTEKKVIFRDFKASNILLDGDFNAKLSDFGLAKLGPTNGKSHVTTRIIGTYGYAAPEYMATGYLYVKSDVYGFGVVLLEIITGLKVLDMNRPNGNHSLVEWVKPFLPNKKKLKKIIDPRLQNQYPSKGAFQIAELILRCLKPDQKYRPDMEEVLSSLEEISTIKTTLRESNSKPRHKEQHATDHHRSPPLTYR